MDEKLLNINRNIISKDDFIIYDDKIYEFENKMIKMNKNLISKLNSNDKWKSNYQ